MRATTKKKVVNFFGKKVHPPDKILATPMCVSNIIITFGRLELKKFIFVRMYVVRNTR